MTKLVHGLVLGCTVALCSCTTVTVKKVDPISKASGVRFALPTPFIQVTPLSDGGLQVEKLLLPDEDQYFAIDAKSFFASHTLDVTVDGGMLSKVSFDADSTTMAKEAIAKGADLVAKSLEAEAQAASKAAADVATAKDSVTTAKATRDSYRDQLADAKAAGNTALVARLEQLLASADAAYRSARARYRAVLARARASGDLQLATRSGTSQTRRGPIFYRVDEAVDAQGRTMSVRLVAAKDRDSSESQLTQKISKPPTSGKAASSRSAPVLYSSPAVAIVQGPEHVVKVNTDKSEDLIKSVTFVRLQDATRVVTAPPRLRLLDGHTIEARWTTAAHAKFFTSGTSYRMTVSLVVDRDEGDTTYDDVSITFSVP